MKPPSENSILVLADMEALNTLQLKPEEAFVLTRVNGKSTLKEISQIVGYDLERTWGLLSSAVEAGVLDVQEGPERVSSKPKAPGRESILKQLDDEDRDPDLSQIPRAKRSELLLRYQNLSGQTYYEILGVDPKASVDEMRSKYFRYVKELHPDRFFGKKLRHYEDKIDVLFKQLTQAFEELSDPGRRKVYDEKLRRAEIVKPSPKPSREEPKPILTGKTLIERIALGRKYFEMAKREEDLGSGLSAANFYQMAVQFEPENAEYRKAFDRMSPFITRKRADDLYDKGMEAKELSDNSTAIELLEQALETNPKKRECYRELALLYLGRKRKLDRAKQLGEKAVELYKNDSTVHAVLGRIYMELGLKDFAKKQLKTALDLDKGNDSARSWLDELKRK